jgi:outer membrane protein assembly factor BamB
MVRSTLGRSIAATLAVLSVSPQSALRALFSVSLAVLATALLPLALPPTAVGQDTAPALVRSPMPGWPQWRGPARDGISRETGLLQAWPRGGPPRLWSATGIGRGYSSPIVVEDTVYITGDRADDLVISAWALDGTLRWETKNGAAWKRSYPGARSACTYDDGRLYHMNAHGRLVCLDAASGAEQWAVDVLERFQGKNIIWGISESPVVLGNRVFATPAGERGLVVALDKRTGETVWATPTLADEQPSYASPILIETAGRTLLVNSAARHALAVDAQTGELCWTVPHEDPQNTVSTIPVLGGNHVVFTNASRGYGAVFGVHLDGVQGQKDWKQELTISHGSTICVDGQVYGASGRGVARGWVAIDAGTGQIQTLSSLDGGSLIYADQRFYCLTQTGTMTLQQRTSDGFQTVGSFSLAEGRDIWAHPVICDGRLYLRVHDTLYCYDIR